MNKEENMKRTKKKRRSFTHLADVLNDRGKAGDTPEEEEKESDEHRDESMLMNPGIQTFLSKQMGVKESGFWDDPGQSWSNQGLVPLYDHLLPSDMLSDISYPSLPHKRQQLAPVTSMAQYDMDCHVPARMNQQLSHTSNTPSGLGSLGLPVVMPAFGSNITHPQGKSPSIKTLEKVTERLVEHQNLPSSSSDFPVFYKRAQGGLHPIMGPPSKRKKSYRAAKKMQRCSPSVRSSGCDSDSPLSLGNDISLTKETASTLSPPSTSSLSDLSYPFEPFSELPKRRRRAPVTSMAQYDMGCHVPARMNQQLSHTSNTPSGLGSLGLPVVMPAFGSNITHHQGKFPSIKTPPLTLRTLRTLLTRLSRQQVRKRLVEYQNIPSASSYFGGCSPSVRSSGCASSSPLSLGNDISSTKETSDMPSDGNFFFRTASIQPASTPSTSSLSDLSYPSVPHKRQWLAPATGMVQYDMDCHVPAGMYHQQLSHTSNTPSGLGSLGLPVVMPAFGSNITHPQGKSPSIKTPPLTPQQVRERMVEHQNLPSTSSDPNLSCFLFHNPTSTATQTIIPTVAGPPCPENSPVALQGPPDSTGVILEDACCFLREPPETEPGGNQDTPGEMMPQAIASHPSTTDTLPGRSHRLLQYCSQPLCRESGESRSLSMLSLSLIPYTKSETNPRAMQHHSSPDILLQDSFERFMPDIAVHENKETYRFQCTSPGLYQCGVTGLVFDMQGEGGVLYRTVPWDQRLLAQHCKKPAGPLFDIKSLQQSVCQLHLPHCETGDCGFLSVAHVTDEGIEFIPPHKITETHVIINITGFSGFGNVKDDNSPPDPIRALVLLFYIPPVDADLTAFLNVLLLPGNIVLNDVLQRRKKIHEDERYVEISPQCKLHPKQEYMLCILPEEDSILVQPKEAEFDSESHDNYFPTFQVEIQEKILKNIKLLLRDNNSSRYVWERRVCLSSAAIRRPCQSQSTLPPNETLFYIRSSFIKGISGPVLKSLLDKLFEKRVILNGSQRTRIRTKKTRRALLSTP